MGAVYFKGPLLVSWGAVLGVESADSHRERGLTDSFVLLGANMWSQALIVTCRPKSLWIKCRPLLEILVRHNNMLHLRRRHIFASAA